MTVVATDYPDYRTLVEAEAPLGFARHFALCEWLDADYSVSSDRSELLGPHLPTLPAIPLGEFTRADNRFCWSDSTVAQQLRQLGAQNEGFAALASDCFDADALSPLELAAACSGLLSPSTAFLPVVTSTGFGLYFVADAPLDLQQVSVSSVMATLREASRYCRSAKGEWAVGLLGNLGFSCQQSEEGLICRRQEEHFLWSFASQHPDLVFGQSEAGLRTAGGVTSALAGLIEQASCNLDQHQDYPATRQDLLRAVAIDPQSYDAQLLFGRLELAEGQLEKAELRLLLATVLRPNESYALSLLGDCYALADKVPQAMAVQERLLIFDPENSQAKECLERLRSAL